MGFESRGINVKESESKSTFFLMLVIFYCNIFKVI